MDSGRYDCIICGVNPKPERQEKYNMSIAYAENPSAWWWPVTTRRLPALPTWPAAGAAPTP